MPSILASQLTNSKITMAMKVTLFVSLMVATLAIPISGVQAFFFFWWKWSPGLGLWYSHLRHCVLPKQQQYRCQWYQQTAVFPSKFVQVNYFTYMVLFFILWKYLRNFLYTTTIYTHFLLSLFFVSTLYIYRVLLQPNHGVFFFFFF